MKSKLFAIGLFAILTCSGLWAESVNLAANIPFGFTISTAALPAGQYTITVSNTGLVTVREADGKGAAMVLTNQTLASVKGKAPSPRLTFQRYGNEYFLSGVWTGREREGHALPVSPRQKELAGRLNPVEATSIAMRTK